MSVNITISPTNTKDDIRKKVEAAKDELRLQILTDMVRKHSATSNPYSKSRVQNRITYILNRLTRQKEGDRRWEWLT